MKLLLTIALLAVTTFSHAETFTDWVTDDSTDIKIIKTPSTSLGINKMELAVGCGYGNGEVVVGIFDYARPNDTDDIYALFIEIDGRVAETVYGVTIKKQLVLVTQKLIPPNKSLNGFSIYSYDKLINEMKMGKSIKLIITDPKDTSQSTGAEFSLLGFTKAFEATCN